MKAAKCACGILSLSAGRDVEKEEGLRFLKRDRRTRLEKKNKNEVVIRQCGCVGKLRCFIKNPNYEWLSREEQVAEVVCSSVCDFCFWEFQASVFVEVCER
ncbi:hypothetical protein LINPERHAP1_LOCUS25166 [Linum perenne]